MIRLGNGKLILQKKELIQIKKGKWTYQNIVKKFNELSERLEKAKINTKLSEKPRFKDADDLMVKIIQWNNL